MSLQTLLEIGRDEILIKLPGGRRKLLLQQFLFSAPVAWLWQTSARVWTRAPGATFFRQLAADGSIPPFAPLAALCFHMLWTGQTAWDAQLAARSGSAGQSPLPKASCLGSLCVFVVRAIVSILAADWRPYEANEGGAHSIPDLWIKQDHRWWRQDQVDPRGLNVKHNSIVK